LKIREHVDVLEQPTVVRLDHLQAADAAWISNSYYLTEEIEKHFKALKAVFSKETGCGAFLIGHYGSGKSHFLAYLAQQIRAGIFGSPTPDVLPISLLNYKSSQSLEDILDEQLSASPDQRDRRKKWMVIGKQHPSGIALLFDELSEFLRSKPAAQSFNEDLRFLQFLGEWSQDHSLWILAALQEQIEHTGEIEYDLFRKIKDRYPIRLIITPAHVKDLIAERILRKKESYQPAVEKLAAELSEVYSKKAIDYGVFCDIYPIHPMTLELLEEVRDRFSQSRGIVDFALMQLRGNEARAISAFLDQPWGHLLTPDSIVDHFADLFEVQPEFLAIAQKVLPYFRKNIPAMFPTTQQQDLAWRLLKLLILVHLSPRRTSLSAEEASRWLLFKASSIEPVRNREIIGKIMDVLCRQGAFVIQQDSRYRLDLEDDSKERLDQLLAKTIEELKNRGDFVFENLIPLLEQSDFNPFSLPRDRWFLTRVRWHFHDWDLHVYFGGGQSEEPPKGLVLQVGYPWGMPAAARGCYKLIPRPLEVDAEMLELSALQDLKDRPLPSKVLIRIRERIAARSSWFRALMQDSYRNAGLYGPDESKSVPPLNLMQDFPKGWLQAYGELILRQAYPLFERFAPKHGPLPKEAYRQFMKFASEQDLGSEEAPDYVKLIREAYLVPMGLMQRKGSEYLLDRKLDHHELVRLLAPLLEHQPAPNRIYQHLSAPVYGLVPDQIHLLLIVLLIQGEIDIVKENHSYRDSYETLIYPLQYDKVLPGSALNVNQLHDLQILCEGFQVAVPRQWSVLAQKRAIEQLRKLGNKHRDQLSAFSSSLTAQGEAEELVDRMGKAISQWLALEKGEHELQGFQHFLFTAGAPQRFVVEANELASMPARFERLLRESRRYRHLFGYRCVSECPDPHIAARIDALGSPPSLAQPDALESWLRDAQNAYQGYRDWYQGQHEQFWRNANAHAIWNYRMPALSRCKHFSFTDSIRGIETAIAKAKAARCTGLGPLDFQPICRCGFDGSGDPLQPILRQFEEASSNIEKNLALFFQQDSVKAKVRDWVEQGLELNAMTLSYLEGKADYPQIENLALFDQHLSGLQLIHPVEAKSLTDLLTRQIWEKPALMKALDQLLDRFGPRISFRLDEQPPKEDLVAWCSEQSLRYGCPLPKGLSSSERSLIPRLIQPQWIGERSLLNLENMNLGEEAVLRILEMLFEGSLRAPAVRPASGAFAAALDLLDPVHPADAEELAERLACLYEQSGRLVKVRRQHWLSHLDKLADIRLDKAPEGLNNLLQSCMDDQWIIVDCLGLPLLGILRSILPRSCSRWNLDCVKFALVSERTSTDAFYLGLIGGDLTKPFDKINAIDDLIHGRRLDFNDMTKLARAELEVAFSKLAGKYDPDRPLLVFGDHGFRLTPDGTGFSHGGSSTIERIVLVARLIPI
jgi:hypothetical protein